MILYDLRYSSPLISQWFMITEEQGSYTTLYCALSKDVADKSGAYFDNCKLKMASKAAKDETFAKELWEKSVAWVELGSGSVSSPNDAAK